MDVDFERVRSGEMRLRSSGHVHVRGARMAAEFFREGSAARPAVSDSVIVGSQRWPQIVDGVKSVNQKLKRHVPTIAAM